MKLRVIATLVAVLAFGVGSASAQSIGLFADPAGASCNITVGASGVMYILAIGSGSLVPAGVNGAEFQVVSGLTPAVDAFFISQPNPLGAGAALGDPMAGGGNIPFPDCQQGAAVLLYTVTILPQAGWPAGPQTWGVEAHSNPSNPNFQCSLLNKCDGPIFTAVCVGGGEAFINGAGDCNVAVEEASWSGVKNLYN